MSSILSTFFYHVLLLTMYVFVGRKGRQKLSMSFLSYSPTRYSTIVQHSTYSTVSTQDRERSSMRTVSRKRLSLAVSSPLSAQWGGNGEVKTRRGQDDSSTTGVAGDCARKCGITTIHTCILQITEIHTYVHTNTPLLTLFSRYRVLADCPRTSRQMYS